MAYILPLIGSEDTRYLLVRILEAISCHQLCFGCGKPTSAERMQWEIRWKALGPIRDLPIFSPIACSSLEADRKD